MITKLPRWVEYGAFVLALTAGSINAVGLLGFTHQAISHISGTATLLGAGVIQGTFSDTLHLTGILISFLLGAALSGALLSGESLRLGRHYETLLAIEGSLLLVAIPVLQAGSPIGHDIASFACGLQNALVTTYSGAVVRTTHLTGIFTDLGIMLGGICKGRPLDRRKTLLFLIIASGFIVGGAVGAWLFARLAFSSLAVPAIICFALAIGYRRYYHRHRRRS